MAFQTNKYKLCDSFLQIGVALYIAISSSIYKSLKGINPLKKICSSSSYFFVTKCFFFFNFLTYVYLIICHISFYCSYTPIYNAL